MKKALGLASAVLMTITLSACSDSGGDSSGADYCDTLKESQTQFSDLDLTRLNEEEFSELGARFDTLEEQAPTEVADDWATVGDRLDEFKGLLDEAGIGLADLATLQQGKLPEGADAAKIQELVPKLQEFTSDPSLDNAKAAIRENAKSECNITLGE